MERTVDTFGSLSAYRNHLFRLAEAAPADDGAHPEFRGYDGRALSKEAAAMIAQFAQWLWYL